jgi:hypothetical protein
VNLAWAVDRMQAKLGTVFVDAGILESVIVAREEAQAIADEDAEMCAQIGQHGFALIEAIEARKPGGKIPFLYMNDAHRNDPCPILDAPSIFLSLTCLWSQCHTLSRFTPTSLCPVLKHCSAHLSYFDHPGRGGEHLDAL